MRSPTERAGVTSSLWIAACGSHSSPHERQKFSQRWCRVWTEMTFHDVGFTATMKMPGESCHRFPACMRGIVVAINRTVNGASLPVKTVPPLKRERKPHVDKTAIAEEQTQGVEIRNQSRGNNVTELDLSNVSQLPTIDQAQVTVSRSWRRLSRLYSRWSRRCRSRHESASSSVPSR